MKKLLALFVLFIMLMQVMGYYIVFRVRQMELKSEVKSYLKSHLDDSRLTRLEFATSNGEIVSEKFEWKEEEKEFRYDGSMFDVIDVKLEKDKLVITCVEDKKENDLFKSFEQIHKRQSRGKNRSNSLAQFLNVLFVSSEPTPTFAQYNQLLTTYQIYQSPVFDRSSDILTPPPKNC